MSCLNSVISDGDSDDGKVNGGENPEKLGRFGRNSAGFCAGREQPNSPTVCIGFPKGSAHALFYAIETRILGDARRGSNHRINGYLIVGIG